MVCRSSLPSRRLLTAAAFLVCGCSTHADVAKPAEAPAAAVAPSCTDVAAATLNLGDATPAPVVACGSTVQTLDGEVQMSLGSDVLAVSLSQTHTWALSADALAMQANGADTVSSIALGGATATDVAAGYGASAFVLDGVAGRVLRTEGGPLTALAQAPALEGMRAMVRVGGSLFAGGPAGVVRVSVTDGAVTTVGTHTDVLDLAVDDVGALLVLRGDGLARMFPDGTEAPRTEASVTSSRIAFDLPGTQLVHLHEGTVSRTAYSELAPAGPMSRPVSRGDMAPFEQSGYILAGAEYWPHRGTTPAKYPEEILWGFYPNEGQVYEGSIATATATKAAVACAEQSHAALRAWIPTAAEALAPVVATGKAPRFYLWVDDYSESDEAFSADKREAKLWYWARDPGVAGRIPGYFKLETVVDRDGTCHVPDPAQAAAFLKSTAEAGA
ncbi:MAG: hypothetical protein AAGA54_05475 [Myxococcota bacterium]